MRIISFFLSMIVWCIHGAVDAQVVSGRDDAMLPGNAVVVVGNDSSECRLPRTVRLKLFGISANRLAWIHALDKAANNPFARKFLSDLRDGDDLTIAGINCYESYDGAKLFDVDFDTMRLGRAVASIAVKNESIEVYSFILKDYSLPSD